MRAFADLLICLRFFSRLPVPVTRREIALGGGGLAAAAPLVPIAGAIIGLVPASVLLSATTLGLPGSLAAVFALTSLLATSGALHEDGLADCADGFGGGVTRVRKLEIMRDSRIGTFGTCAIVLSLAIRIAAVATLQGRAPWLAAAVLVLAASLSRTACLVPLCLLPPSRPDGLGAATGPWRALPFAAAVAGAVGLGLALVPLGTGLGRTTLAIALAFAGAAAVSAIAYRQIGGQTGDVAGAAQQVAECLILSVFAAAT